MDAEGEYLNLVIMSERGQLIGLAWDGEVFLYRIALRVKTHRQHRRLGAVGVRGLEEIGGDYLIRL